jgi:pilus assembly protein CpaB
MTRPQAVSIVAVVALLFAGLASWGVYDYLQKQASKAKAGEAQNVVVAVGEIPIGTKLDLTQMKTVPVPKASMQPGSATDPNTLVGRVVIRQLSPGDAITEGKMMPKEGTSMAGVMSYIIPQGHRAVTVGVNEVAGVAGFVAPNNRVDVVLTTTTPKYAAGEKISKIILQNVTVLATGQITEQKDGKPVVVPTVTLDLMPEEAERLINAASQGSLQLLLRSILDTVPVEARGATITKVLTSTAGAIAPLPTVAEAKPAKQAQRKIRRKPAAARQVQAATAPRRSHSVTFIDGGVRTTKEFVLQ